MSRFFRTGVVSGWLREYIQRQFQHKQKAKEAIMRHNVSPMCPTVAAFLFTPFFFDLGSRAWDSALAAMSTSMLAIASGIAFGVYLLILSHRKEGWAGVKNHFVTDGLHAFIFGLCWWFLLFSYQFLYKVPAEIRSQAAKWELPPLPRAARFPSFWDEKSHPLPKPIKPMITRQQVVRYGNGIAIQLVVTHSAPNGLPTHTPIASGFWISDKGYAVTCFRSMFEHRGQGMLNAGAPMPPLLGQNMVMAGGAMFTPAQIVATDENSGLAVLRVYSSPFERQMHGFATAQNKETGKLESVHEQYWVPTISTKLATGGDEIVAVGFNWDEMPIVNPVFGFVTRAGVDSSKQKESFRLYTSLKFNPTDCGAPILSKNKEVIGVIGGPDSANSDALALVVPSEYLMDLIERAKIPHGNKNTDETGTHRTKVSER